MLHTETVKFPKRTQLILILSVILWLCAVGVGLCMLWDYENSPGITATAPAHWPTDSQIQLAPERATLIMFAHPHCPCSRASIGELAKLMTRCQGQVSATVLFFKPEGFPSDWEKTDLWSSAELIPGVRVMSDEGGIQARSFNAATSGQVVVYDAAGQLVFSGGITISRGHAGDNTSVDALTSLLITGEADRKETLVFGCPIFDIDSVCAEGDKVCNK
jgi:hypothetical protein